MNHLKKNLGLMLLITSIACPPLLAHSDMSTKTRVAITGILVSLTAASIWKRQAIQRRIQSFISKKTETELGCEIDELQKECLVIKGTMSNYSKTYNDENLVSRRNVLALMNNRNCNNDKLIQEIQTHSENPAIHCDLVSIKAFKKEVASLSKAQDATLASKKSDLNYLKAGRWSFYAIPVLGVVSTLALWKDALPMRR